MIEFDNTKIAFAGQSNQQLRKNGFLFLIMNNNWIVKLSSKFITKAIDFCPPVEWMVKKTVFSLFCGGENIADCQKKIEQLGASSVGTILDYSVEGIESDDSFDEAMNEILRTIDEAKRQSRLIPFAVFKVTGIASFGLLEKIQANQNLNVAEIKAYDKLKDRIEKICLKAFEDSVKLFFDAEESWIQNTIDSLCNDMMKKFNKKNKILIYNTYQFYRWDTLKRLTDICDDAKLNNYGVGAKLVRGAYMEKERQRAITLNYKDPIHLTKENTDEDFNSSIEYAIQNLEFVNICLGTHNESSTHKCIELMDKYKINHEDKCIWFAQLLGMSDNITYNLGHSNYNVAKYVPYGPIKLVMPYLLRRAEENTSIAGQSSREFLLYKAELARRMKN